MAAGAGGARCGGGAGGAAARRDADAGGDARADPRQRGDVVVISDGEDQVGRANDAIAKLRARGVAVSAIAVGTTRGATIPNAEGGGPLRDDSGAIVTTYAKPDALELIAQQTGG